MQYTLKSLLWTTFPLATINCLIPLTAGAQITEDGTTSTTVETPNNQDFTIENGDRVGDNLFHSFEQFSVPTMGSAAFNNANDIANIFSRVTGSNISNIDGLISANGAANLFLINPNGIIFGENARLNLGGSFFASTADSLLFDGGLEFSASNPSAPPLLEVNIPIGLSFRDNPGEIINQSTAVDSNQNPVGLQMQPGKNITFAGANISFDGGIITAPGGRVELGGLAAAGTVNISENGGLTFPDGVTRADISLSDGAFVNVANQGGGFINVNARNLDLLGGSQLVGGIAAGKNVPEAQAGDITLDAKEIITFDGINTFTGLPSGVGNNVESGATGNGGDIQISAKNLSLTNGTQILTIVRQGNPSFQLPPGEGNAGNIIIDVAELVSVDGISEVFQVNETNNSFSSLISSSLDAGATGKSGQIDIKAGSLSLTNGGLISSSTFGNGNAGKITLDVTNDLTLENANLVFTNGTPILSPSGVLSNVGFGAEGDGGAIDIAAKNLSISNGAGVNSSTSGRGNAGNINLNIDETIALDGSNQIEQNPPLASSLFSNVESGAVGNGGIIDLKAKNLSLTNGAQILTIVRQGNPSFQLPPGEGNAGNIIIDVAELVSVDGISEVFQVNETNNSFSSLISSSLDAGATGKSGQIDIKAGSLSLTNGGLISSSTFGNGNAGKITLDVTNDLTLENGNLVFTDGIPISFPSGVQSIVGFGAEGDGGAIDITAKNLAISNGAVVNSSTSGRGNAGSLTISASKFIELSGINEARSGLFASALIEDGSGGNLQIFTKDLIVRDGAAISVSNFPSVEGLAEPGTGEAGNLLIEANSIHLENDGRIDASTASGKGGNIDLAIAEDIIFRNNSLISARALGNANGGNIKINANNGSIVAFPNQDNDIIANAQQGKGGNISITTQAIFGLEERRSDPLNQTNDIDASSEFGLQGDFSLNTPENEPSRGLVDLPENVGNPEDLISQNLCEQGVGSEFIITGKGGIPPSPNENLNSNAARVDLVEPIPTENEGAGEQENEETEKNTSSSDSQPLPAQGWIFNDKGEILLTAYNPTGKEVRRSWQQQKSNTCSTP